MAMRNRPLSPVRETLRQAVEGLGALRITTSYAVILVLAILVLGFSIFFSERIAGDMIQAEYMEYNETIFHQAVGALNGRIQDLTQLCYAFMSSKPVVDYLQSPSFEQRSGRLEELNSEFNRLSAIQGDIRAITLYDLSGKMVATAGIKTPLRGQFSGSDRMVFRGLTEDDPNGYFQIEIPVFDIHDGRVAGKAGYCHLLVQMSFLESSLSYILPGENYFCMVLEPDGDTQKVLLHKGVSPSDLPGAEALKGGSAVRVGDQLLYAAPLSRTSWSLLFGVPHRELYANINSLQRHYYISHIVLVALILALLVFAYAGILRPIRSQIRFMNEFARHRQSRMTVRAGNEMGELARNLNSMLDNLERLTDENLAARNRVLEAEYRKKQSELLAYRSQINPHFLSNTFECIRGMALYQGADDIARITESLAALFTYNLRGAGYAPLSEVRESLENYLSILRYRFGDRFRFDVSFDPSLDGALFPKMILQPLVENAIFHGLEAVEEGGCVTVTVLPQGDTLRLSVEDNGVGMTQEEVDNLRALIEAYRETSTLPGSGKGLGVVNIFRRLFLFYGDALDFSLGSSPGKGTGIRITVPRTWDFHGEGRSDVPSLAH